MVRICLAHLRAARWRVACLSGVGVSAEGGGRGRRPGKGKRIRQFVVVVVDVPSCNNSEQSLMEARAP